MAEEKSKEWVSERHRKYQNENLQQTLLKYGDIYRRAEFSINGEGDLLRNGEVYRAKKYIGKWQVQYAMCSDPVTEYCISTIHKYLYWSHNIDLFEPSIYNPPCRDIHYASSIDALRKTGALILLGGSHLYRSTGVLNRLKNMGWALSRVPCPAWVDPVLPEGLPSRVLQESIDLINERRCHQCKGSGKDAWGAFFTDASAPKPDCTGQCEAAPECSEGYDTDTKRCKCKRRWVTCNGAGFVLPPAIPTCRCGQFTEQMFRTYRDGVKCWVCWKEGIPKGSLMTQCRKCYWAMCMDCKNQMG